MKRAVIRGTHLLRNKVQHLARWCQATELKHNVFLERNWGLGGRAALHIFAVLYSVLACMSARRRETAHGLGVLGIDSADHAHVVRSWYLTC